VKEENELLETQKWTEVIRPDQPWYQLDLGELGSRLDLMFILFGRDFIATYKQTVLGVLWFLIQPLFTTAIYYVVFTKIAHVSVGAMPPVLFYLSGIMLWNFFSESSLKIATTFLGNATIIGKVYFPRLVLPISSTLSSLVRFGIQFFLFFLFWIAFLTLRTSVIKPNSVIFLIPFIVLFIAAFAFGLGLIVAGLTTKYRDLLYLLTFGLQLFMYASPVIYPLSAIKNPRYLLLIQLNPLSGLIEAFRYGFFGSGALNVGLLIYDVVTILLLLAVGLFLFKTAEKTFIDTV